MKTRGSNMSERQGKAIRRLRVKKTDDAKAIYAKVKRSFTAADLQAFTEIEDGVPAEDVLAKLESMAKQPPRGRGKG
jgi:hypothetical protein